MALFLIIIYFWSFTGLLHCLEPSPIHMFHWVGILKLCRLPHQPFPDSIKENIRVHSQSIEWVNYEYGHHITPGNALDFSEKRVKYLRCGGLRT